MTTLFFLLEGSDDERFFKSVLKEKFSLKYSRIKLYRYAHRSKKQLEQYIHTLNNANKDYIILADFDNAKCVSDRKNQLISVHSNFPASHIAISKSEIESWYLSGLNQKDSGCLGIPYRTNTEDISKEEFDNEIPSTFSRVDFMNEILKKFKFECAMKQNPSFEYFSKKYLRHCIKT